MAFVQTDKGGGNSTSAATAGVSTTTGNCIVVWIITHQGLTAATPTDTAGNTYTALTGSPQTITDSSANVYGFSAKNITGNASNIITSALTGSASTWGIMMGEFSGRSTSAPIDNSKTFSEAATTTSHTSGALTPNTSGVDLVCLAPDSGNFDQGGAITYSNPAAGWTFGGTLTTGGTTQTGCMIYINNQGASAATATWTTNAALEACGWLVSLAGSGDVLLAQIVM